MDRVLIAVLTNLVPVLVSWIFSKISKKKTEPISEAEVDAKLSAIKVATSEALDGTPMTKEQRDKLNKSIADFIHSSNRM